MVIVFVLDVFRQTTKNHFKVPPSLCKKGGERLLVWLLWCA